MGGESIPCPNMDFSELSASSSISVLDAASKSSSCLWPSVSQFPSPDTTATCVVILKCSTRTCKQNIYSHRQKCFILFFLKFYLLILAVLGLRCCVQPFSSCGDRELATLCCGVRASPCGGFSCCGARAIGTRTSVAVAHGLSCSMACRIFLDQGSNPCPLHWQEDSYPLCHWGSPRGASFFWTTVSLQESTIV